MSVELRGRKWRRYGLAALALAAFAGPGNAAGDPRVVVVQHELKLFNPLTDAILNGEKHVRKKAGRMLAEGDCTGAKRYALRKGRFDVVSAIDRQCNPAGPATISTAFLSAIRASNRNYSQSPAPATSAPVRPSLVAPVVINDYSVPIQR